MGFLNFFRRKKRIATPEKIDKASNDLSVAYSVLMFISLGLTNGAESLSEKYKSTKITEFVAVSLKLLDALKQGYEHKFASNFVAISVKVNNQSKDIEMIQLGRDVMLSLGGAATVINNITLVELYANLRHDMIKHPEIYGQDRQSTALSYPEPDF